MPHSQLSGGHFCHDIAQCLQPILARSTCAKVCLGGHHHDSSRTAAPKVATRDCAEARSCLEGDARLAKNNLQPMYMEGCRSRGILLPCFLVGEAQHGVIVTWPIDNKTDGCSARGRGVRHRLAGAVTSTKPRSWFCRTWPCRLLSVLRASTCLLSAVFAGIYWHL